MGNSLDTFLDFGTSDIMEEHELVVKIEIERLRKRIIKQGGEKISLSGFYVVDNSLCGAWHLCGDGYGAALRNPYGERTLFKYPKRARQAIREEKSYLTRFQKKYVFDKFKLVKSTEDFWIFPDGSLVQLSTGDSVKICNELPEDFFLFNRIKRKIGNILYKQ